MDRHRGGGDRYGNSPNDSHPYRHPRGGGGGGPPPSRSSDDGPMMRHRGGFPGNRRPFDNSPPRYSLSGGGGGGGFHPMDGDGGFRPLGVRAARNYNGPSEFEVPLSGQKRFNPDYEVPMSGQKRQFPFPGRGGSPPDRFDGGNFEKRNFDGDNFDKRQIDVVNFDKKPAEGGSFAKLFVGSVPKTATEEDIRPVFEEHGNVVEVALIKDKRTGQQQGHTMFASAGCCFIKYATSEDADRAIRALHNQYTLPGGMGPIQVRYADGERERLVEFKLFVGSLNKQATEKEVEEIFLPYGRVEDVYLMRDEMKQSRGCGFVKFSNRDVAMAAINALNGIYIMRGCEQPLIVRFADPKRPRPGETRPTPGFGGSGFGPRMQSPGIRPPNVGEMMHGSMPLNAWHPMSQQGMGPASDIGMHGYGGGQVGPRSSDGKVLSAPGGGHGGVGDNMFPGAAVPSSTSNHQSFNPSLSQLPSGGQNLSPLKKQNQSPHLQTPTTFSQPPPSTTTTARPTGQLQPPPNSTTGQQPSFSQPFPSQPIPGGFNGMMPPQSNLPSTTPQPSLSNNNLPPHLLTAMMNQYQMPVPGQQQQSPSPLAQMLTQQKQTLQASYQSSQQAFSQLQQQLQLMQPSPQGGGGGGGRWPPQAASANPGATPGKPVAEVVVPPVMPAGGPSKCSWTEHTSPDGYKYYYNSTTGESKWEKPEELALFEQQQKPQEQHQQKQQTQMPSHSSQGVPHQQSQGVPHQQSQGMPHQQTHSQGVVPHQQSQIPQIQLQNHLQTQMRHPPQMQHATQSSMYPNAGVAGHQNMQGYGYAQMPVAGGSMNDSARFQQGMQGGGQEWMWKNKTGPGS